MYQSVSCQQSDRNGVQTEAVVYCRKGGIGITVFLTAEAAGRRRPDVCFSNKNRFMSLCRD
ncbi:hypothetical protein QSI_3523 [Clostridioides difficile P28]|nr:hypothetical protein QSI_3523 [Clostridioides difficile P28]